MDGLQGMIAPKEDGTAFARWMDRHKLSSYSAAVALGCSRTSVQKWREKEPPLYVLMACAAYSVGVAPIR
jgi:hypothetical protein